MLHPVLSKYLLCDVAHYCSGRIGFITMIFLHGQQGPPLGDDDIRKRIEIAGGFRMACLNMVQQVSK